MGAQLSCMKAKARVDLQERAKKERFLSRVCGKWEDDKGLDANEERNNRYD